MPTPLSSKRRLQIAGMVLVIGLLGLFTVRNWQAAKTSLLLAGDLPLHIIVISLLLIAVMFCCAAGAYVSLALKSIVFRQAVLIELAANAVNKLIPSGIGGMGVHGLFLHRQKHSLAQAAVIVSVNNALGMLVHCAMLLLVVLCVPRSLYEFHLGLDAPKGWILPGTLLAMVVVIVVVLIRTGLLRRYRRQVSTAVQSVKRRPRATGAAALCLLGTPLLQTTLLLLLARYLGIDLTTAQLFIALSVGIFLGAIVPTPGGLGGVEAGIVVACTGFGIDLPHAMALALSFRLLTYWAPLLPGFAALLWARQQKLL